MFTNTAHTHTHHQSGVALNVTRHTFRPADPAGLHTGIGLLAGRDRGRRAHRKHLRAAPTWPVQVHRHGTSSRARRVYPRAGRQGSLRYVLNHCVYGNRWGERPYSSQRTGALYRHVLSSLATWRCWHEPSSTAWPHRRFGPSHPHGGEVAVAHIRESQHDQPDQYFHRDPVTGMVGNHRAGTRRRRNDVVPTRYQQGDHRHDVREHAILAGLFPARRGDTLAGHGRGIPNRQRVLDHRPQTLAQAVAA